MSNFVSYSNAEAIVTKIGQKFEALNGAYILKGTSAFASLPATLTGAMVGYVYNVTDEFTTDSRFITVGETYPAGTNIAVADLSTYDAVSPVGSEDPSDQGWYEIDAVTGKYVLSEDTTVDSQKTYYEKTESYKFDIFAGFIDVDGLNERIDDTQDMIAPAFDDTSAYEIGDVVTYEDGLYKFKAAHTANDPWDPTEVDATTMESLVEAAEPDALTTQQINTLIGLLG